MSNSGFAAIDALIHGQLLRAGLADSCVVQPFTGASYAGRCIVQRSLVALVNRGLSVSAGTAVVDLIRETSAPWPAPKDTITVGADTLTVVSVIDFDESKWVIECRA